MQSHDDFNLEDDAHIDLTPLIDVIFMLVIFFILTMSFSQPVLDVVLPTSKTSTVEKKHDVITIKIKKDGLYYYEEKSVLIDEIEKLLDENPEQNLNIYPDLDVPFQSFVTLLDVAQIKRQGKFGITTQKPQQNTK